MRTVYLFLSAGFLFAAGLLWHFLPPRYEAAALMRVSAQQPGVLIAEKGSTAEFDLYKRTQAELIRSNPVTFAVARDPAISKLPTMQQHNDEQAAWLRGQLMIDNPGDSEVLSISMRGERPEDLVKI